MHVNLFTPKFQAKLLLWRRLRQWSLVWSALILVGGVGGLAKVPSLKATREGLEAALSASEPTRLLLGEIGAMEGELTAEEARTGLLQRFGPDRRPLSLLGALGEATRASGGRVYLRSVQYANAAAAGSTASGNEATGGTLVVEGISLDDESVDRFVHDLVDTGEVSHVELKSCVRDAAPAAAPGGPPRGNSSHPASSARSGEAANERLRFEIHCRV